MEILLFDSVPFRSDRLTAGPGDIHLKIQLKAEQQSRTVQSNSSHEEYRQKVVAALKQCEEINNRILPIGSARRITLNAWFARMHGFLQENLDSLWVEGLKVRIQVYCISYASSGNVGYHHHPAKFCADIPIHKTRSSSADQTRIDLANESCIKSGLFSEVKDVLTNPSFEYAFKTYNSGKRTRIYGFVTVSLISGGNDMVKSANDQLAVVNIEEQGLARICKKILDSKLHFDGTLVAKDGTVFDCNKAFLAAQSEVLAAMLETDMKEAKTNQIEMKDMTAIGVKALLEYIYTLDLDQAFENCDVALEILQAGHKYNIKSLEKQVSSILLKKDVEWYTVDMAFSLFLITRKVDSMKDIKLKAVSLLMSKINKFMECQTYQNLFQENPAQSSEALQELFFLSHSK